MTEYENNKIIDMIYGMTEEEREIVIFAINKYYNERGKKDEEKYPYSIVNSIYS